MKNCSPKRRRGTKATIGPARRERLVTIYVDKNGDLLHVVPDPFKVSKRAHHEVLWRTSPPNAHFSVNFEAGSPFHYNQFSHVDVYSGLVRREVPGGDGKYYKYIVTAGLRASIPVAS